MPRIIYRTIREIVDPAHTALVLWDVQQGLVDVIFNKEEFLRNLKALLQAARANNIPVIYTLVTPLPLQFESPFRIYLNMRRYKVDDPARLPALLPAFMKEGSPEAEIPAEVAPREGEVVLKKHTANIFTGTHFEYLMRNSGIDTLLFTGISTEAGIDTSARDAASRSFYTVVVTDCVSAADKEMHDAALKTLRRVCLTLPFADIMKEWP